MITSRKGKGQKPRPTEPCYQRTNGPMTVKPGWDTSLTEAGVNTCDELLVVVVKADVRPEIGTGLKASGIVAVKLTTTVEAAKAGGIVLLVDSVVVFSVLDDDVAVTDIEAASDNEVKSFGVPAAVVLPIEVVDDAVDVRRLSNIVEDVLIGTTAEMGELRIAGVFEISREVGPGEEVVIDSSNE